MGISSLSGVHHTESRLEDRSRSDTQEEERVWELGPSRLRPSVNLKLLHKIKSFKLKKGRKRNGLHLGTQELKQPAIPPPRKPSHTCVLSTCCSRVGGGGQVPSLPSCHPRPAGGGALILAVTAVDTRCDAWAQGSLSPSITIHKTNEDDETVISFRALSKYLLRAWKHGAFCDGPGG